MAFIGYQDSKNTKPNAAWWAEQIRLGKRYRRERAYEEDWDQWRRYYRCDYGDVEVLPVNVFFSNLNSLTPRVYFRNPTVSLTPGVPGIEAQLFARVLQRMDNKLLTYMGVKKQMKRMIRDTFLFGTGMGKLGFGGRYSSGIQPYVMPKQPVEYGMQMLDLPWFQRVSPGRLVVPWGTTFLDEDARWIAYEHVRSLDDVKADERFDSDAREKLNASEWLGDLEERVPMVSLYEVQDSKTKMCFVLSVEASGTGQVLYAGPDQMQTIRQFSGIPLIFNENDNAFWGVPDAKILDPYQRELNETRTQMCKHRRVSVVKILAQRSAIKESEVEKFVSEDVLPVIWTEDDPAESILPLQAAQIPQDLRVHALDIMGDIREGIGFSRNQMGEFNSSTAETTATEVQVVKQAAEIRIDERRDMCADLLVDMVGSLHEVLFLTMPDQTVVDMVGPSGAIVWVQFKKDLIRRGRYTVNIDPDSSLPQTQALREQRAMQVYQVLAANPFVDPIKLSIYLTTEMVGTQFDDILRGIDPFTLMQQAGIDPSAGASPETAMNMDQFDQMNRAYATQYPQQLLASNKA